MQQDNIRYNLDFYLIPKLFYQNREAFIRRLLIEKENFLFNTFNKHYIRNAKSVEEAMLLKFRREEFCLIKIDIDIDIDMEKHLLYAVLPHEHSGSLVYCKAYVFTYIENEYGMDKMQFFTVEKSVAETTCIGSVAPDSKFTHINYGDAYARMQDNINKIIEIAFQPEKRVEDDREIYDVISPFSGAKTTAYIKSVHMDDGGRESRLIFGGKSLRLDDDLHRLVMNVDNSPMFYHIVIMALTINYNGRAEISEILDRYVKQIENEIPEFREFLKYPIGEKREISGERPAVGFIEAIKSFFKNYTNFSGRARRSEYFFMVLAHIIVCLVCYLPMFFGMRFAGLSGGANSLSTFCITAASLVMGG